jgi:3-hydroxyacyl-[acyl-carrier-protein] dehydratase
MRKPEELLLHRAPFLFVDEIESIEYLKASVGYKHVLEDEFWVKGHFPNNPIFPGVLILETMAQIGGLIIICDQNSDERKLNGYLTKVDKFKVTRKVQIGDSIKVNGSFIETIGNFAKVKTIATVNNKKVAEAIITYAIVENL